MKILIAYDGSQGADDTLHDFPRAGLSLRVDAPIMSVAEVVAPPAGPVPPAVRQAWAEATQAVAAAHAGAVGTHGLSRVQRFPLGGVSAAAAACGHCSVEIVRPPHRP